MPSTRLTTTLNRDEPTSKSDFVLKMYCGFVMLIIATNIVPFICFLIGMIFLKRCPAEPMIPIFLIVFGLVNFVDTFNCIALSPWPNVLDVMQICIFIFQLLWLMAGSYWVFWLKPMSADPLKEDFCNDAPYFAAKFMILLLIVLICITILIVICSNLVAIIRAYFENKPTHS